VGYIQGYAVVGGALDEEREFSGMEEYRAWAEQVLAECRAQGVQVEIYHIYHAHEPGVECECVQYLTDYRPDYTWIPGESEPEGPTRG